MTDPGQTYQIQDDCRDMDIFWMAGINQRIRAHMTDPSVDVGGWDYSQHELYDEVQAQGWQQLSRNYPTLGRINANRGYSKGFGMPGAAEVIECHIGEGSVQDPQTGAPVGERSIEGWWLVTEGEDPSFESYQSPGTRRQGDEFTTIIYWAEYPCLGDLLDVTRGNTRPRMTQLTIRDNLGGGVFYEPATALPIGKAGGYPWPPRWIDDLAEVKGLRGIV